jgi:hypothetical protein
MGCCRDNPAKQLSAMIATTGNLPFSPSVLAVKPEKTAEGSSTANSIDAKLAKAEAKNSLIKIAEEIDYQQKMVGLPRNSRHGCSK